MIGIAIEVAKYGLMAVGAATVTLTAAKAAGRVADDLHAGNNVEAMWGVAKVVASPATVALSLVRENGTALSDLYRKAVGESLPDPEVLEAARRRRIAARVAEMQEAEEDAEAFRVFRAAKAAAEAPAA